MRVRSVRGSLVKVKTRAERESVDEAIIVKASGGDKTIILQTTGNDDKPVGAPAQEANEVCRLRQCLAGQTETLTRLHI